MVNELIDNKKRQGEFLGTSVILRFFSSLLSILAISLLLFIFNSDNKILIVVSLIQALMLIFQSINILDYWFQSELKSKYVSIAKMIATLATGIYSGYLLFSGKDVFWFAASTVLTSIVVSIALLVFYFKQSKQKLSFSVDATKFLLSRSHHFIISSIMVLIYLQIDKFMIGNMKGNVELGIYSVATMMCTAWMFLPESITTSLRPGIVSARSKNYKLYLYKLKRLYFIVFWVSMFISLLIALLAPFFIPVFFGKEYESAIRVTQLAVWFAPLSALGYARNVWIVSEKKYKYNNYYLFIGLVVNVALNFIVIPTYGIMGAAFTTVLTEVVTLFIAPLFYKQTRIHTPIVMQSIIGKIK